MGEQLTRRDLEALGQTFMFRGIDTPMLNQILDSAAAVVVAESDYLFRQGAAADRFFLVVAGQIGLSRGAVNGDEKIVEIIGPGQTFAEALMFMGAARYPVSARALGTSRLIALNCRSFIESLRASTDLCFRLMANMSVRLHRLLGEVEALTQQSAAVRVVNFLLAQIPEGAVSPTSIALPAPKQVIASRLSIKPETLSRILHELTHAGIIEVKASLIEIIDIKALTRFASA